MRPFDPHDKIYVGTRVVTTIKLYNPRDGIPVMPALVTLHSLDPNDDIVSIGEMELQLEAGEYEGSFLVDAPGNWKAIVEVGTPFESVFAYDFHVGASPLD
jgi:hypothetical protein